MSGTAALSLADAPSRLDWKGLGTFLAVACGYSWAVVSPLFFLREPSPLLFTLLLGLGMFGPALGALVAARFVSPVPELVRETGLTLGRGWARFWVLAWLGTPALVLGALALSALLGRFPVDLVELSGARALLAKAPGALADRSLHVLVLGQAVAAVVLGPLLNAPVAFGEEWGWRGYLLPRLLPLGQWRALLVHGALWGLWHAPVIALLGYNYPEHRVAGVLFMVVSCVLLGILFGWTRLSTGSVWPAVIAHGGLNALAPIQLALAPAGVSVDSAEVGVLGWPGWLLMGVLVLGLVLTRRLPVRDGAPAHDTRGTGRTAPEATARGRRAGST